MILINYRNKTQQVLTHLIFWLLYLIFFSIMASLNGKVGYLHMLFSGLIFVPVDITATYLTIYLLIPKFLMQKKYISFIVSFISLAFLTITMNQLISFFVYIPLFLPEEYHYKYEHFFEFNYWYFLVSTYTVVVFGAGIKLTKLWIKEQQAKATLETQHIKSELIMLKSQINPHFLFNTLNNIDSLIHSNPDKASESIVRLSELLRYVTYEINNDFVPIEKEEQYLKNYCELHSLRYGEQLIEYDSKILKSGKMIAPMLLIPLVENAIKHGDKKINSSVKITLKVDVHIEFSVINQIPETEFNKDKVGGIGLVNMKRRLELLYPGKYVFEVNKIDNNYITTLWIK